MDAGRQFLEEQVRAKTEKRLGSVKALNDAFIEYTADTSDLIAFQKALEAYTRGTDAPYHPPQLDNPLEAFLGGDKPSKGQAKHEETPPSPERITKRSIILETFAKSNGKGLKVRELHAALPKDAPIQISLEDLYRALPSLKKNKKIWQDKMARYHLGPKPATVEETEELEVLFEDKET